MSDAQEQDDRENEEKKRKEAEGRRKRSISLSVRLTSELQDILKDEAERQSITISALVTNILTKYSEWDRSVERFGLITIGRHSFKAFPDSVSEEKLIQFATEGGEHLRDYIQFWRSKPEIEDFLKALQIWSKEGKIAQCDIKKKRESEGNEVEAATGRRRIEYTITLYHDFGEKWTKYLKNLAESALRSMFNTTPEILETSNNSLTLRFSSDS